MARIGAASSGPLAERVALVTGAASDAGRAVAEALAAAGVGVVTVDSKGDGLRRWGKTERCRSIIVDVAYEEAVAALIRLVLDEFGRIDILVNSAGAVPPAPLEKITEAAWGHAIRVNLVSAFLCSRAVVPSMLERRSGRIINLTGTEAFMGAKNSAHYAAAAGGMLGFAKSLALELAPHNITVNTICPDPHAASRRKFPPAAFAGAALFLAGDEAAYVTGQTLFVNRESVHGHAKR